MVVVSRKISLASNMNTSTSERDSRCQSADVSLAHGCTQTACMRWCSGSRRCLGDAGGSEHTEILSEGWDLEN